LLKRVVHAVMNRLVRMRFRSHMYGLVGFVKQLVDEAGMDDITHPAWGTPPARASKFSYIQVSHGQVFIAKAGESPGRAATAARSVRVPGRARPPVQAKKRRKKKP
jgi:hypothetical protein